MSAWIFIGAIAALVSAASVASPEQFGEECAGAEVVQMGSQPPKTVPFKLEFSVDLPHRTYCVGDCSKASTWPIKAVSPGLITLSDVPEGGPQSRHMTLDVAQSKLQDVQVMRLGDATVARRAVATCKPAPFHPGS